MGDEDRLEYLERRVAFLEATLAKFLAFSLHSTGERKGKTKAKARAAAVGSRKVLTKALDAALIDLSERAELTPTEAMAMPDPKELRGMQSE
ncbi:MAG: hypothetical protein V3T08_01470 [Gemmatimonadota bacterium]